MAPAKSPLGIFINLSEGDVTDLILKELSHYQKLLKHREIVSLYFIGYGKPEAIRSILEALPSAKTWKISETLEVNLACYQGLKYDLEGLKKSGVTRVNWAVATEADLTISCRVFENVGYDIYYGRGISPELMTMSLQKVLDHPLKHISLYEDQAGGTLKTYDAACAFLKSRGFIKYDPFHFALPEYISVHQMIYNTYGDYMALGPCGHGRFSHEGAFYATENEIDTWRSFVRDNGHGLKKMVALTPQEITEEIIMQTLSSSGGIPLDRARELLGHSIDSAFNQEMLAQMKGDGFIEDHEKTWRATTAGQLMVTTLAAKLLSVG